MAHLRGGIFRETVDLTKKNSHSVLYNKDHCSYPCTQAEIEIYFYVHKHI